MTCIIAIAHENHVYMGGERAASDGKYIQSMDEPKICTRGEYLFGYAGNIGVGQLVMSSFSFPDIEGYIDDHMHNVFSPALRTFFSDRDMTFKEEDDVEFLVAARGRVYSFHGYDHQLVPYSYTAIGSGGGIALGSLYTTSSWKNQEKRIHTALSAAIDCTVFCRGPIDILSI